MSDDIVTRLREAVRWCDHGWNLGNDWYPAPTECRSCIPQREGADEIERLRAEVQTWKNLHRELWVNGHNKEEQQ